MRERLRYVWEQEGTLRERSHRSPGDVWLEREGSSILSNAVLLGSHLLDRKVRVTVTLLEAVDVPGCEECDVPAGGGWIWERRGMLRVRFFDSKQGDAYLETEDGVFAIASKVLAPTPFLLGRLVRVTVTALEDGPGVCETCHSPFHEAASHEAR